MPDVPVSQKDIRPAAHENGRLTAVEAGRADIAAGRVLTPEHIDDWIARLGTRDEMPPPQSMLIPS
jgi:predicted transcriptional regulator